MMKIEKKILFIGKSNDIYSKQIIKILKRRFRFLKIFLCKGKNCKPNKKILNWKGDIIFSFRSYFILSKKFINKAKICAINFHPGPPSYRGIGCVNFALSNNENIYGCTAHLMDKKIDNGKILYSLDIAQKIAEHVNSKKKTIFINSFSVINDQLFVFLKNSYLVKFTKIGKTSEIIKLPAKLNSQPIFIKEKIIFINNKNNLVIID